MTNETKTATQLTPAYDDTTGTSGSGGGTQ